MSLILPSHIYVYPGGKETQQYRYAQKNLHPSAVNSK